MDQEQELLKLSQSNFVDIKSKLADVQWIGLEQRLVQLTTDIQVLDPPIQHVKSFMEATSNIQVT